MSESKLKEAEEIVDPFEVVDDFKPTGELNVS